MKYSLEARIIAKESFLHKIHFDGIATFISTTAQSPNFNTWTTNDNLIDVDLPSYSDIFLIEISLTEEASGL